MKRKLKRLLDGMALRCHGRLGVALYDLAGRMREER